MIRPDSWPGQSEKFDQVAKRRTVHLPCILVVDISAEDDPQAEVVASELVEEKVAFLEFGDTIIKFGGFITPHVDSPEEG